MSRFAVNVARAIVAAALLAGCVDLTPLMDSENADAGHTDGGVVVAEASVQNACRACVVGEGGACRPQYDICAKDDKCKSLMDCGLDIGCFTVPVLQDRIACFGPCLKQVGIMVGIDPSLQLGLALNACAQDFCAQPCFGN